MFATCLAERHPSPLCSAGYPSLDKARWGYPSRTGHFEIAAADFELIAEAMEVDLGSAERGDGA